MVWIWFEPHSTTLDNEAKRASGWNDVDLSSKGLEQSNALIERSRNRNLSAIFCSDLQRAVKSAVPTADNLHIPIYPDKRLRECNYGDFTLKPSSLIEEERPKRIKESFPNGESYDQVLGRMKGFFDELKRDFDDKTIMIIGHRATHYAVEYFVNNQPLEVSISEQWQWQPGWKYELQ